MHAAEELHAVHPGHLPVGHDEVKAFGFKAVKGFDTAEESNTAMPADFLMQQMEWRDAAAEARRARDRVRLARLRDDIKAERGEMLQLLERALDAERNYDAGCSLVRKLRFLDRLEEDIGEAIEPSTDAK